MFKFNPTTNRLEDEQGNPAPGAVPMDQVTPLAPEPPPPTPTPGANTGQPARQIAPPAADPNPLPPAVADAAPSATAAPPTKAAPTGAGGLAPAGKQVSTTKTVVDQSMVDAEKRVADADEKERKALALEQENRLREAEIQQRELETKERETAARAERDRAALAEGQRRRQELEEKAKLEEAEYLKAANDKRTFFGDQTTGTRVLWGLSLLFGAAVQGENPGAKLLDQAMGRWEAERENNIERLRERAQRSGGLLARFWQDYGAEVDERRKLEEGAAYLSVAEDIRKTLDLKKGLLTSKAIADAETKAAEFEAKAAAKRQAVVEARAGKTQGTMSWEAPKPDKPGDNLWVTGAGGKPLFKARDAAEHKEASDKVTTVRDVMAKTAELEDLIKEGRAAPLSARAERMNELQTEITQAIRVGEKMGAFDNGTEKALGKMVPNGAGIGGNGIARLQQFRKGLVSKTVRNFDKYGVDGAAILKMLPEASAGASEGAPAAPPGGGRRMRLKDGRVGVLYPDGTFEEGA